MRLPFCISFFVHTIFYFPPPAFLSSLLSPALLNPLFLPNSLSFSSSPFPLFRSKRRFYQVTANKWFPKETGPKEKLRKKFSLCKLWYSFVLSALLSSNMLPFSDFLLPSKQPHSPELHLHLFCCSVALYWFWTNSCLTSLPGWSISRCSICSVLSSSIRPLQQSLG